jgi:hypothetical protein
MAWVIGIVLFLGVALLVILVLVNSIKAAGAAAVEAEADPITTLHGAIDLAMVCPHCQQPRQVRTKQVVRQWISGDKAAAILAGGLTMLDPGLTTSVHLTRAFCGHCKNVWEF